MINSQHLLAVLSVAWLCLQRRLHCLLLRSNIDIFTLSALQELCANLALLLDPTCALALETRARCRQQRGDFCGAEEDLQVLKQLSNDKQQVCPLDSSS